MFKDNIAMVNGKRMVNEQYDDGLIISNVMLANNGLINDGEWLLILVINVVVTSKKTFP